MRLTLIALAVLALPGTASAHAVGARFGAFYAGALHPLTALEHLLPMLVLCLLAGQQQARAARWILLALPAGMLLGTLCSALGDALVLVRLLNLGALVALGGAVALALRPAVPVLAAVAVMLGATVGYENGAGLPPSADRVPFALGSAGAAFAFAALAAAMVVSLRRPWMLIAVRAGGSWVAAIGLLLLGLELGPGNPG